MTLEFPRPPQVAGLPSIFSACPCRLSQSALLKFLHLCACILIFRSSPIVMPARTRIPPILYTLSAIVHLFESWSPFVLAPVIGHVSTSVFQKLKSLGLWGRKELTTVFWLSLMFTLSSPFLVALARTIITTALTRSVFHLLGKNISYAAHVTFLLNCSQQTVTRTNVFCFRRVLSSRMNALGYLRVQQTTTLSQQPSVEAELASHTPRKINDL